MMSRWMLVIAALLAIASTSARAGDASTRHIIGFSPDGNYFAFEQYGTLDWSESDSGWSEIVVIDTRTDQFAVKPVYVADESGNSVLTLRQARAKAAARARPFLLQHAIAPRGERVASDSASVPEGPIGYAEIAEIEQAAKKTLAATLPGRGGTTVSVREMLAASAADCSDSLRDTPEADTAGKARGFRLSLDTADGKPVQILHEDTSVPASRKCPTSYALSEAYLYQPKSGPPALAVLVQRFSQGFEGRDRRFIAVTARLP